MRVRIAGAGDDAGIRELFSRVVMPGEVTTTYRYRGSFFEALEAEGERPTVLIGEKDGGIVAVATVTKRTVYLGGSVTEVGYLASLRLAPEVRGSRLLMQGFRLLAELQETEVPLPWFLTSIMGDNQAALATLTGGRAGLPQYRLVGSYRTAVIPVLPRKRPTHGCSFQDGVTAGRDVVVHCLQRFGAAKDLFKVHGKEAPGRGLGLSKGLGLRDFLVAWRGGEPVGVVALWDQSSFRELVVTKYAGTIRFYAALDRLVGLCTGSSFLPRPGEPFAPRYLSCVAVKDNDPALLEALMGEALARLHEEKQPLLITGLFRQDRLCAALDRFLHIPFYSNIYAVAWMDEVIPPFGDCYLDAGSL